jgi:putative DNA primase/helicase
MHACWVLEGRDREIKVGCFICEDWRAIKAAILDDDDYQPTPRTREFEERTPAKRIATAQRIWNETAHIGASAAERYLTGPRGLEGPFPDILRFHRSAWHFSGRYPALAAKIERFDPGTGDYAFAGAHLTYLAQDGHRAGCDPDRLIFGVVKGAGAWLAGRRNGGAAVAGEGLESTLSAMEILEVGAGVAALSASGMRATVLPASFNPVWIAADNDVSGTGERAAEALAERLRAEGRAVRIVMPDIVGTDFNDLWLKRKAAA